MRKLLCFWASLILTVLPLVVPLQASGEVWDNIKAQGSAAYEKAKQKLPEVKDKAKAAHEETSEKISEFRENQEAEFWQNFEDRTGVDTGLTDDTDEQSEDTLEEGNAASGSKPETIIPTDSPVGSPYAPAPLVQETPDDNVVDQSSPIPSPVGRSFEPEPIGDTVSYHLSVSARRAVIVSGVALLIALAILLAIIIDRCQRKR